MVHQGQTTEDRRRLFTRGLRPPAHTRVRRRLLLHQGAKRIELLLLAMALVLLPLTDPRHRLSRLIT